MDQFSDLYVKFFYQKSLNFSLLRLQEIYFFIIKSLQRNLQIITLEGLKPCYQRYFGVQMPSAVQTKQCASLEC